MRPLLLAILLAGTAVPVVAQESSGALAAAAPAPSEDAQKAMWCAAAFALVAKASTDRGTSSDYEAKASAGFSKAAAELIPNGMTVEQFRALAEKVAADVAAPFRTVSYSEADCSQVVSSGAGQ